MNNNPIGIIDSGLGGLSIWKAIIKLLPYESTIYVGDHAFLPYGTKTASFIKKRIIRILKFLTGKNIKLAVIACNAATVTGIDYYRNKFPHIPLVGVVPVIKTAAEKTVTGHVAVLSTLFTAKSRYQRALIKKYAAGCTVENIGCSNLVSFVEKGIISGSQIKKDLKNILQPIVRSDVDVIALGCTHYPFLADQIRSIVGSHITLLDSGGAVARHTERILKSNNDMAAKKKPTYLFFTTGRHKVVTRIASDLIDHPIIFDHIEC